MPNIGLPEILLVLVIVLVIFGPKRLPEMGRSLGKGIREFKSSVTSGGDDDEEERQEIAAAREDAPIEGTVVREHKA
jgi:sec-independent protein translocase protein TatA